MLCNILVIVDDPVIAVIRRRHIGEKRYRKKKKIVNKPQDVLLNCIDKTG